MLKAQTVVVKSKPNSALGQKQTCAVQNQMSAKGPNADIGHDSNPA